jgi:hypothetical protein
MEYKVVDNFLPPDYFKQLQEVLTGNSFAWHKEKGITNDDSKEIYFYHLAYWEDKPQSLLYEMLVEFKRMLFMKTCIRMKANLYLKTDEVKQHGWHKDFHYSHKGAVFYLNTNDGFTILKDGHEETKIESIANRVLFFDPSVMHTSTSCTNAKGRVTLNFNYV